MLSLAKRRKTEFWRILQVPLKCLFWRKPLRPTGQPDRYSRESHEPWQSRPVKCTARSLRSAESVRGIGGPFRLPRPRRERAQSQRGSPACVAGSKHDCPPVMTHGARIIPQGDACSGNRHMHKPALRVQLQSCVGRSQAFLIVACKEECICKEFSNLARQGGQFNCRLKMPSGSIGFSAPA